MTRQEHAKLLNQLTELCTFLPALSEGTDFVRLRMIYERGGKHMLDSKNAQHLIDTMYQHVRELRKLARLFAVECHLNLAQGSTPSRE